MIKLLQNTLCLAFRVPQKVYIGIIQITEIIIGLNPSKIITK
jgi:hypothetical protein